MDRQHFRFWPNKALQVLDVTSDDICFGKLLQQERFHHAQAIGHILRTAVRPRVVNEGCRTYETMAVFDGDGCRKHLLPDTMFVFTCFGGGSSQYNSGRS